MLTTILIFIAVLLVLIVSHEWGHFWVAKRAGIRVDEFGIGFPPRLFGKKKGETLYSINALPFGGFVKIFGEDATDEQARSDPRSFVSKPKLVQAAVLIAGVAANMILAWVFISGGYLLGVPGQVESAPAGAHIQDQRLALTTVLPGSPADHAGLQIGDTVTGISSGTEVIEETLTPETFTEFIATHPDEVTLTFSRGGEHMQSVIDPQPGVVEGKEAIGVGINEIATITLPVHLAFIEGFKSTIAMTGAITAAIAGLIADAVTGSADTSSLAGPVGIAGLVGDAADFGFAYLLNFTALISIHLAILNLIPFPALDGGRLLFLGIEAVKGSPITPNIAATVNGIGFALLILLMIFVTYQDIIRLVS